MYTHASADARPIVDALLLTTIFAIAHAFCTTFVAVPFARSLTHAAAASSVFCNIVSNHANRFTTKISSAVLGSYNVRCSVVCGSCAFSASTLLVGRQEGHLACKKTEWWGAVVVI